TGPSLLLLASSSSALSAYSQRWEIRIDNILDLNDYLCALRSSVNRAAHGLCKRQHGALTEGLMDRVAVALDDQVAFERHRLPKRTSGEERTECLELLVRNREDDLIERFETRLK